MPLALYIHEVFIFLFWLFLVAKCICIHVILFFSHADRRDVLSFTKPSKGIVAILVADFLAHAVFLNTVANFALKPAKYAP